MPVVMLRGLVPVQQAAIGNCSSFSPFSFDQNGLASPEVDVGGRQIADGFVIAQVIVFGDEGLDLGFEVAGWKRTASSAAFIARNQREDPCPRRCAGPTPPNRRFALMSSTCSPNRKTG